MTVSTGDAHVSNITLSFPISWSGFVYYNFTILLMEQNILKRPEHPDLSFSFMEIANVASILLYFNFKASRTPWSQFFMEIANARLNLTYAKKQKIRIN